MRVSASTRRADTSRSAAATRLRRPPAVLIPARGMGCVRGDDRPAFQARQPASSTKR